MNTTLWYIAGVILAMIVMYAGELIKNETKEEYVERGYNWNIVLFSSSLSGVIGGLFAIFALNVNIVNHSWNPYFLPFAITVASYITVQSFMTDFKILKINRQLLRFGYIPMYAISVYNVLTSSVMKTNGLALIIFTGLLILIFIFSSIGASDVRAMTVLLPYVISIGGFIAIIFFSIVLLIVSFGMGIRNIIRDRHKMTEFKVNHMESYESMNKILFYKFARDFVRQDKTPEEMATPVGPYMITPFLIFLLIFPFIAN